MSSPISFAYDQDFAFEMIFLYFQMEIQPFVGPPIGSHPHPGGKRCARCCQAQEGLGFLQDSSCRWGADQCLSMWMSEFLEISWVFLAGSRSSQCSFLASSLKTWKLQLARLELLVTKTCIMCIHRCLIVISSGPFSSLNMTIYIFFGPRVTSHFCGF